MGSMRTSQARTYARRPLRKTLEAYDDLDGDELAVLADEEPPLKRLRTSRNSSHKSRWVPGGPGGGGRHIDLAQVDGASDTPQRRNKKPDQDYSARSRSIRRSNKKMSIAPRASARSGARGNTRPRYSTAAAASAAAAHGDGYKPREERGWEEYHPDLDLEFAFAVIDSEEVDGRVKTQQAPANGATVDGETAEAVSGNVTPSRKKPGRPVRTRDSMLHAILTPEAPKVIPPPGPNPRERLTLPKPSYRTLDPFLSYEQKEIAALNFVNQTMASVGYQESEIYIRPERTFIRQPEQLAEEDLDLSPELMTNGENSAIGSNGVGRVEYDMDEQDVRWLEELNKKRIEDGVGAIKPAVFEITMTKIEKEWYALEKRIPKPNPKAPQTQRPRSSSAAAVNGEPHQEEGDSKCAICDDGDCENANAIVFCDGCDLAVHQECYGVPYIPEGQWLCRKCQLVGNSRPSCIFCPNEGGAFKQTINSKWAHLFCSIWIPEITIANPSLMEPITDVEKVPLSRWKLHCYICKQDMGASIQCSDGRCYEAFHLTCARQAGLYLKMKSGGGQGSLMDSSQLRAFCHRHTPADWQQEHGTDKAFEDAVKHYKSHFQGQVWADSRASALAAITESQEAYTTSQGPLKVTLTNRKGQKQKTVWRLPSGAPVIPEVILKSIEDSLVRFSVQKKKEFVAEICKYWTLKREARRGAALLKRLQLQMDTFSSFEVTRRDYKAQGATGRARLDRRITFAETLAQDLDRIVEICSLVKEREAEKVRNAALLKELVDTVYFPLPSLLGPILDKILKLDIKGIFRQGLFETKRKLGQRQYASVASFSADLAQIFSAELGIQAATTAEVQAQISEKLPDLSAEQRDCRTLARRIIKAVQPALEDATRKQAELNGRPYAQQLKEMDEMMLFSRRESLAESVIDTPALDVGDSSQRNATYPAEVEIEPNDDIDMQDAGDLREGESNSQLEKPLGHSQVSFDTTRHNQTLAPTGSMVNGLGANTPPASTNGIKHEPLDKDVAIPSQEVLEPPTPPISLHGIQQSSLAQGGIPWYVEQFDPDGTTIYEERWTGREALSEELSEMDEDELQDLGNESMNAEVLNGALEANIDGSTSTPNTDAPKGYKKTAKRIRGNNWGERSFRNRRWR